MNARDNPQREPQEQYSSVSHKQSLAQQALLFPFSVMVDYSRKPEISNLDAELRIEKQVSKFEVPVDDIAAVEIRHGTHNLEE